MSDDQASTDYDAVCRARQPAECVSRLGDAELVALGREAERIMARNGGPGGLPSTVKWLCVMECAERFAEKI